MPVQSAVRRQDRTDIGGRMVPGRPRAGRGEDAPATGLADRLLVGEDASDHRAPIRPLDLDIGADGPR